ncbi:MAG TPA: molecular chaperone DnaJ [Sphingobium sp.]|nr:molecular chaperone DnaJ [Sphingobium sp.]
MGLVAIVIAGMLAWLVLTGRMRRPDMRQMAALILTLAGGVIGARGQMLIGGAMAIAGLIWLMRKSAPAPQKPVSIGGDARAREALDLLGLPPDADRAAVVEAHRRLIARNHPDAGGTEALARSINGARDYLLAILPK